MTNSPFTERRPGRNAIKKNIYNTATQRMISIIYYPRVIWPVNAMAAHNFVRFSPDSRCNPLAMNSSGKKLPDFLPIRWLYPTELLLARRFYCITKKIYAARRDWRINDRLKMAFCPEYVSISHENCSTTHSHTTQHMWYSRPQWIWKHRTCSA